MKISTKGRYGLRTLMDIALHQQKGPVTLKEIADRQKISVKYLWQVINPLKQAGILRVTRGAKGGYILGKHPDKITMHDIVTVLEGPIAIIDCLNKENFCEQIDNCVAHTVWSEVSAAVENVLLSITFASVLKKYLAVHRENDFVI